MRIWENVKMRSVPVRSRKVKYAVELILFLIFSELIFSVLIFSLVGLIECYAKIPNPF